MSSLNRSERYLYIFVLTLMTATINTSIGNTYILALKGYIPLPFYVGEDLASGPITNLIQMLIIVPLISSILVSLLLSRYDIKTTVMAAFAISIETVILSFLSLTFLPQILGDIQFLGYLVIFSRELVLFVYLPVFPLTLGGAVIGTIIGDRFIYEYSSEDEKRFKESMERWVDFLSEKVEERERESEEILKDREIDLEDDERKY